MYTTIKKWKNSQAASLPKAILDKVSLKENDKVEIRVQEKNLLIVFLKKHITLKKRISGRL